MTEKNQGPRRRKESPITVFLAVILLILTLVTPLIYNAPKNRLSRAVEKSTAELMDEEVLRLLGQVFWDGSFEATGESSSLSYTATLPGSAALSQQGSGGSCRVAFRKDRLYLQSSGLGDEAYSTPREGAAAKLCDSAFSDAGMPKIQMRLLRSALAFSEDGLDRSLETLKNNLLTAFRAGKPKLSAVQEELLSDGKERRATAFTYEIGEEGLRKALASWKRFGQQSQTEKAFSDLRGVLSGVFAEQENEEAVKRFVSFLCGQSAEYEAFEQKLLSENGRACLKFTVCKGRILEAGFLLGGGDFVLECELTLSEKLRKNATWSVHVAAKDGETELFSLAFGSEITEESKSALIRRWNYSVADSVGAFCASSGKEVGEIIFSWGKKKGDIGLRVAMGEEILSLRGELLKYKKGKAAEFSVNRVELNGKRISEDDSYTVNLSKKGETPTHREATEELFPEGEKRQTMAQLLAGRFQRFTQ